jgi:hypothetical protein
MRRPSIIKKIALLSSDVRGPVGIFCSPSSRPVLYRSARHFRQLGRHWLGFGGWERCRAVDALNDAYTMTVSSYVEAVKQVEILLALLIGWLVFGEGARIRQIWLGCTVMLAGILILILGKG